MNNRPIPIIIILIILCIKQKTNSVFSIQYSIFSTQNKDDGYSAFEATNVSLADFLREEGVTDLYVCGLATDYCVKATALDACKLGFRTYVITDAVAAVNLNPGDDKKALEEISSQGCILVNSNEI
jgi:nicotinamidase/pyrazinamidase